MSDVLAEAGPFRVVPADEHNHDFHLTDEAESVRIGFDRAEIGDLDVLCERLSTEVAD